jgi:dihydrofolate reductase
VAVAQLNYLAITSLDGYIEDENGMFGWGEPSEEVHAFVNELARSAGTYLYGRRMYETMVAWETDPSLVAQPGAAGDFARIWQAADKIVYSTRLTTVSTRRTRIERTFDPETVTRLKGAADRDLMIGGATIAAEAFKAGLVDECHLFLAPVAVGGGIPFLPRHVCLELELLDQRRFANGTVYLRYRLTPLSGS